MQINSWVSAFGEATLVMFAAFGLGALGLKWSAIMVALIAATTILLFCSEFAIRWIWAKLGKYR